MLQDHWSTRLMRIAAVLFASGLLPCMTTARAQDQAEYQISSSDAEKQARAVDREDAKLVRLLDERASDLSLDNYHVAAIKDLLKGWRAYTLQECELIGQVTGGQPVNRGTFAQMCLERRYIARIQLIRVVTRCLQGELRKNEDERRATECLTTLTPLMVRGDYDA